MLAGFELRSEAKIVRWPDRYADPRGQSMWQTVLALLDDPDLSATTPQPRASVAARSDETPALAWLQELGV